jgi:hypothetical protein
VTGHALVLRSDARSLPLPDASVDLIVTSPPYFALRSYTDGGEHYAGQIGSEATPLKYSTRCRRHPRVRARPQADRQYLSSTSATSTRPATGPAWAGRATG